MFANVRTTLTTLAFLACACIATGSYVKAYGDRPLGQCTASVSRITSISDFNLGPDRNGKYLRINCD